MTVVAESNAGRAEIVKYITIISIFLSFVMASNASCMERYSILC